MATPSASAARARPVSRPLAAAARPRPLERPSPFVKWVGGKGRILAQLVPLLPPGVELMRHVEPFVGGGALFFHRQPTRALLCDVNPALVGTYLAIRDEVEGVISALESLAEGHSEAAYYAVRERYAMFIYLNKTCFNGLHRVNRQGHFNVPAGRYKNPRILAPDCLRSASA